MDKNNEIRNIFIYETTKEYKLIHILRNLIYLHSTNGKGYKVNLINDTNIHEYILDIPIYFDELSLDNKENFIKVNILCEFGGIWLNSNTLVIDTLDTLFDIIENNDGFFIKQNNEELYHGIVGSKKQTSLMIECKNKMMTLIEEYSCNDNIFKNIYDEHTNLYENYKIFDGVNNLYPIHFDKCIYEFIELSYDHYKNIIREYQPLIVVGDELLHQCLEKMEEKEILTSNNIPISYFIKKSFENMILIDYDFIEIGTSNFDTLIQIADDKTKGISVDAVKYYIDNLPNKINVKKINVGISNVRSSINVYYIPEKVIEENNFPKWLKGCNCINDFHPLHIIHNITNFCKIEKVNVITTYELFYENSVRKVNYLKIDTEGHDCVILKTLYFYIKYLPSEFYPNKILFETNEWTKNTDVDEIIFLFTSLGYKLEKRGYDSVLIF